MLPLHEPLKFVLLGDTVTNEALCQRILIESKGHCIGNCYPVSSQSVNKLRAAPPDLILLNTHDPPNDIAELHNAFLGNPPPTILLLTQDDDPETLNIYPSIIHVMKPPFEYEEIKQSIVSVLNEKRASNQHTKRLAGSDTILLSTGAGWQLVKLIDIVRLKSDGNYITFYTSNGEKFTVIKTMKYFEEKLPNNLFFRVHQSHIINFKHIVKVLTSDGYSIIMNDGFAVPLSKDKKERFRSFLQNRCIS